MIVAVTAQSDDPQSDIDPRFGRAQFFHIINTEDGALEVVDNSKSVNTMQGAGIQAAETLSKHKVEVLLTGHCGPKAFRTLNAAGIKIVIGVEGKITDAVDKFKKGEFKYTDSPDVEAHW